MPISLVSHYITKPQGLINLIINLQNILFDLFSKAFTPYQIEQVHGTIIGMETSLINGHLFGKWCIENEEKMNPIQTEMLKEFLQHKIAPFSIQIGGYHPGVDYGFESRNEIPFERSFSIQSSRAVINGWPVVKKNTQISADKSLADFRNKFKPFNICHKWNKDGYEDNDFFMVLGKVDQIRLDEERIKIGGDHIRDYLSTTETIIEIDDHSLSLVEYESPELPIETTRVLNLRKVDWNQILHR